MFDLVEEELSSKKNEPVKQGPVFSEEQTPIYTMPATFRRQAPKASHGNVLLIIFGSLFGVAIIGTGVFLYLSSQKQPSPQQPPQQQVTQEQQQPVQQEQQKVPQTNTQQQTSPESTSGQPSQETQKQSPEKVNEQQQIVRPQSQKAAPTLGVDTDQDGLTDVEERLFTTDPNKSDTDGDGFSDGNEVKNLYDPTKPEARLDVSGLVNTYTNQTFKYSLLYPSSWVAKAVDSSDRDVMISSASGEFFTVSVQDNPNKLSPVDWVTTVAAPGTDSSRLQSFSYDTWSGVMAENSQEVYLTRNEKNPQKQTLMYVVKYNLNTKNELNFVTTFQMMLRSFRFTDLSFVK